MKIARVFPRKTSATPSDALVFLGEPPMHDLDIDEVHVDCTFSYDLDKAKFLAESWDRRFPGKTKLGGVALGDYGEEFTPGLYLKPEYTITSRGCINKCWFCDVWRREGNIRELKINPGTNLLDSNILACSEGHIRKVFDMLEQQPHAEFTGGLEAKLLKWWHIELLYNLRPRQMFFAYDTEDDLEPMFEAGKMLRYANFTRFHLRCYVLIGWKKDTMKDAERRLCQTWEAGFMPMAMLWKNKNGDENPEWRRFQREWVRPPIIKANIGKKIAIHTEAEKIEKEGKR